MFCEGFEHAYLRVGGQLLGGRHEKRRRRLPPTDTKPRALDEGLTERLQQRPSGVLEDEQKGHVPYASRPVEELDADSSIEGEGQEVHVDHAGYEDRENVVHGEAILQFKNLL